MIARSIAALALLAACAAPATAQGLSAEERQQGFVPLFDGTDFTGWRFSGGKFGPGQLPKNWSVGEGMIRLSGGGAPHLATEWEYDDFDVRLEWKAHKKGYNSGFYIRSGRQVGAHQINLAQKDCGHLMGGAKGGVAVPELQKAPGEWNSWRVLAVGDTVTFWCNGQKAWEVTGFKAPRGYLGLQAEGAAIDFRNLRIKELGYTPVELGTPSGWAATKGGVEAKTGAKPLALKVPAGPFVLRLEYKVTTDTRARLTLPAGQGQVDLAAGAADAADAANRFGGWNYLEVTAGKSASAWLNGAALKLSPAGETKAGPALVVAEAGPLTVRNVRIRSAKD